MKKSIKEQFLSLDERWPNFLRFVREQNVREVPEVAAAAAADRLTGVEIMALNSVMTVDSAGMRAYMDLTEEWTNQIVDGGHTDEDVRFLLGLGLLAKSTAALLLGEAVPAVPSADPVDLEKERKSIDAAFEYLEKLANQEYDVIATGEA